MLRRDTSAEFEKVWNNPRYSFYCSAKTTGFPGLGPNPAYEKKEITQDEYDSLLKRQQNTPVKITEGENHRTWWMFKDEFYWEDEGYTALEVQALVLKRIRDKERKVKRAKSLMDQERL